MGTPNTTSTVTATPAAMASAVVAGINNVVGVLTAANVALPVIVTAITGVIGIVKMLRSDVAPALTPIIDKLEAQVTTNTQRGEAELARLKALRDGLTPKQPTGL